MSILILNSHSNANSNLLFSGKNARVWVKISITNFYVDAYIVA